MNKNDIVELLKDNRLHEALEALDVAATGTPLRNDVIILSSSYAEYVKMNRTAVEDFQTLEIKRAKITNGLLSVLDEIPTEALANVTIAAAQFTPNQQPPSAAIQTEVTMRIDCEIDTDKTTFSTYDGIHWQQRNTDGLFVFKETKRENKTIFLYDEDRDVTLQLNLATREVLYNEGKEKPFLLYYITAVQ